MCLDLSCYCDINTQTEQPLVGSNHCFQAIETYRNSTYLAFNHICCYVFNIVDYYYCVVLCDSSNGSSSIVLLLLLLFLFYFVLFCLHTSSR